MKILNNKFIDIQSITIMFDNETSHADVIGQFVRKLAMSGFCEESEVIDNLKMADLLLEIK